MCITNEAAYTYILLGGPRGSSMWFTRVIVATVGCDIAPCPQNAAKLTRKKRRVNPVYDRQPVSVSIESRPNCASTNASMATQLLIVRLPLVWREILSLVLTMAVFHNLLPVLKIYSLHHVHYRFSRTANQLLDQLLNPYDWQHCFARLCAVDQPLVDATANPANPS
ncbi:hypothetical protein G5I_01640 [Acromyrmex echinatior]|uniref:Uncharacterized protein n=1 Tax=Acromyrmex echinatior TaxID=103372 RepID=F4W863_ACREC|nr:hypothetical protein G5I_01640 [Acromyrmex echinatior]